ncbi:MAG: carbon starvation protein A, partial [Deltaproteobacteria bacterium]|nr:carbon starvation protein A [Deltaproteobacteria bacterium]
GYLVYTGNIAIIWPLFGMSNQLLAACALIVGTTMIIAMGKMKYSWITAVPGILMLPVTMSAGYYLIEVNLKLANYLLVCFAASLMILMAIVFVLAFRKWYLLGREAKAVDTMMPTAT